ncbi:MAG: hypothetical protein WCH40_12015 [Verrucomicrobiales bacterium]
MLSNLAFDYSWDPYSIRYHYIYNHGSDQREFEFTQQFCRFGVIVALVRFQVGDVLHAALNSLRHEQGLLLGSDQIRKRFAYPFAVAVVGEDEAPASIGFKEVDGHGGRPEFNRGMRTRFSALLRGPVRSCSAVCHQFVTSLVPRLGDGVNFASFDARNPLVMDGLQKKYPGLDSNQGPID